MVAKKKVKKTPKDTVLNKELRSLKKENRGILRHYNKLFDENKKLKFDLEVQIGVKEGIVSHAKKYQNECSKLEEQNDTFKDEIIFLRDIIKALIEKRQNNPRDCDSPLVS